jgi:hypothetical protein
MDTSIHKTNGRSRKAAGRLFCEGELTMKSNAITNRKDQMGGALNVPAKR